MKNIKKALLLIVIVLTMNLTFLPFAIAGNAWISPTYQTGGSLDTFWWDYGYDDPGDNNLRQFTFKFGDGNYERDFIYPNQVYMVSHVFYNLGTYTQEFTVFNDANQIIGYATATTVINTRWAPEP